MKKILFITNNWLTDYGGRRVASTKIINNISRGKFDITVVDFEVGIKPISKFEVKKNIIFDNKVHLLTYFIKSHSRLFPYLINISKTYRFDIVVCSGSSYFDIVSILTIKIFNLFKKTKLVLFNHTHPLESIQFVSISIKNFLFHLGYYVLSYFVYGFFDRIVTPGSALKDFFVSNFRINPEKISVINYPIYKQNDLKNKNFEEIIPSSFHNGNKKIIVTAARLVLIQKDFPTLFKALKEVNKKINCQLVILGEGIGREKIIKLAEKIGVLNEITLLGFKKNPIAYLQKADVFVLSTFFEGCPIVLVEAMIGKVPVVSSDCDFGPKEILENGKSGILVPINDHKTMAKAILNLLENNQLRRKFINNGFKRAKFYSEERSFDLWDKLLSRLS